jgi:hypothetical protein
MGKCCRDTRTPPAPVPFCYPGCKLVYDAKAESARTATLAENKRVQKAFDTIESWINRNSLWKPGTDERYCNSRMLLAIVKTQKAILRQSTTAERREEQR